MRCLASLALALVLGCGAEAPVRDQWLVTVATDAAMPQFGDRILVEILNSHGQRACDACRRIVGVTATDMPLSFGIVEPADGRYRVRVRLYRADHTGSDGLPSGAALIDALGVLPDASGVTPVVIVAQMDCFGVPAAPAEGLACRDGAVGPVPPLGAEAAVPAPGSWPRGQSTPCGAVDDDMVCIEGGAFLLGSPFHLGLGQGLDSVPEQLVVVDAFALERDEVTVGAVRQLVQQGKLSDAPFLPNPDPKAADATCLYLGAGDSTNDAMPVNCVSHALAQEICAARGRRLPTEAEWEFAAGQRTLETTYPWGYDDDVCAHAVVAVGRYAEAYAPEPLSCRLKDDGTLGPWGPVPGGHPLDVTAEGVNNLGGNLAEWVLDGFVPYTDGCFEGGAPALDNPLCGDGAPWVYRGSAWLGLPAEARAFMRHRAGGAATFVGLRCASSFSAL